MIYESDDLVSGSSLFSAYTGDGFTCLWVYRDTVMVEDYRFGTFTAYSDTNYHKYVVPFTADDGEARLVKCCSDREKTMDYIESHGLHVFDSTFDYAVFLDSEGRYHKSKMQNYDTSPEYFENVQRYYSFMCTSAGGGCDDVSVIADLVAELKKAGKNESLSGEYKRYWPLLSYGINSSTEVNISVNRFSNGKYSAAIACTNRVKPFLTHSPNLRTEACSLSPQKQKSTEV